MAKRGRLAAKRGSEEDNLPSLSLNSQLSKGHWVKIRVADNGIHMLTHARLKNMGFSDPSEVRLFGYGGHLLSESNPDLWIDDLCEVPLWRGDDRLLFYANGPVQWTLQNDGTFIHTRNPYSDYGYYFLTDDAEGEPATFPYGEAQPQEFLRKNKLLLAYHKKHPPRLILN